MTLLYAGLFLMVTQKSAAWVLSFDWGFYVLAPVSVLFALLMAMCILLGSINFDSKSLCFIYTLLIINFPLFIAWGEFRFLPITSISFFVYYAIGFVIVQYLLLKLIRFKAFRQTLECLVSTGMFFLLLRQLVIFCGQLV